MGEMRKLIGASIKMLFRDKQTIFWAMAFPVIFAVVFGLFDFDQAPEVRIAVNAPQETELSETLVGGLKRMDSFEVKERRDLEVARRDLEDGDLDVVLAVPKLTGPPNGVEITAYYNRGDQSVNQLALGVVSKIVDQVNLRISGVTAPPLRLAEEAVDAQNTTYFDFLLPGLVAMGVMNFSIIGMSVAITRFREQRILRRILATPLPPSRFLAAQVAARLLLALMQTALILTVGVFLLGGQIHGNVVWLFVLAALANLIFLNIGFAVAGRASNPDAAQGLGNAVALPMMFLSGVFFPTDTLPDIMQTVVRFLPLTPLIEAMRSVSLDGESLMQTGSQLGQLAIWMVVTFLIATRMFRFSDT